MRIESLPPGSFIIHPIVQLRFYNRIHLLLNSRATMHKMNNLPPKKKERKLITAVTSKHHDPKISAHFLSPKTHSISCLNWRNSATFAHRFQQEIFEKSPLKFEVNTIDVSFSRYEIFWHDRNKTMNSFGILGCNKIAHSLSRFSNVFRRKLNIYQHRRRYLLVMDQTLLRRGMLRTLKLLKPNVSEQTYITSEQYVLVPDFVCKFTMNTFSLMLTNTSKTLLPQLF